MNPTLEIDAMTKNYGVLGEPRFVVTYEARKRGAIGAFGHEARTILDAKDKDGALAAAFDMLQSEGYETRNPVNVKEV